MKSFLAAVVAVFAWYLIWDNFLGAMVNSAVMALIPGMAQIPGSVAEPSKLWETVGDFFAAVMVVGVYARTRSVWGVGAKQGAIYGVYAGLLINFPTWLFASVYLGWPYRTAWAVTIVSTLVTMIVGAIAGTIYQMTGGAKA